MLGDTKQTLSPTCHEMMEAEANYAAGQLLFLGAHFSEEATSSTPNLDAVKKLSNCYGNTVTSTLWRLVERGHGVRPMVALVTGHPHPGRRGVSFNPAEPCRYCIESLAFSERFGHMSALALLATVAGYCGAQRGASSGKRTLY